MDHIEQGFLEVKMASKTKSAERFKQEIAAQRARAEALQHLTETGSGPSQRELAQQEKERSKYLNMTSETIRMRLAAQSGNISNNSGGAPTKDNTLQEIRANRARQMIHQLGTANQQYNYDSPGGVPAQFANLYPCSTSAPTNSSDLPDGWREAIDPSSGSKYYWNQVCLNDFYCHILIRIAGNKGNVMDATESGTV